MGRQKLLEPIDGRPMILRAIGAAAAWPTVVVASAPVAAMVAAQPVRIVANDAPERGMNHSLALADAAIDPGEPLAVLLGDLPDSNATTIARVLGAYDDDVDVLIPRAGKRFGHPVVFGPNARRRIPALGDGDGLQRIRDDPSLRRRFVDLDDPGAFDDIDTEDELAARLARP